MSIKIFKMSVRYTENVKIDVKESVRNDIENIHTSRRHKTKTSGKVVITMLYRLNIDKIQNKADLDAYIKGS